MIYRGARLVRAGHVFERKNVRRRLDVRRVELVQLLDVADDRAELGGEALLLLFGEAEARRPGVLPTSVA